MTMNIINNANEVMTCPNCGEECANTTYVHARIADLRVCDNCLKNYNYDDYQGFYTEYDVLPVENTYDYIEDDSDVWSEYDIYCCDDCGNLYRRQDMYIDDYGNYICDDCYENYYTCAECGRIVPEDEMYEYDGSYYCSNCYEEVRSASEGLIEDYGHTRYGLKFYKCDDEDENTKEYFGVEVEIDDGDNKGQCSYDIDDVAGMEMYYKNDSSLNSGFEIVSSPATLRYHIEKGNWKEMMQVALEYGFRSHDTDTCGLHVHVSRNAFGETEVEQELHIAILMMLESKFADQFHQFARRYSSRWARDNLIDIKKDDNFKTIKDKAETFKHDRYYAINVTNSTTVEFRCFKGTLKYSTFVATLQFVATMVRYCQQITTADVESIEWEDIFYNTEFKELREYMESRGLL